MAATATAAAAEKKKVALLAIVCAERLLDRISYSGRSSGGLGYTLSRSFCNIPHKNEDSEALRPGPVTVVPDEVIEGKTRVATVVPEDVKSEVATVVPGDVVHTSPGTSDKYWTPHPETGVFIPEERIESDQSSNCSSART